MADAVDLNSTDFGRVGSNPTPGTSPTRVETAGQVVAVCRSDAHTMSKPAVAQIELVAGIGVEGDAHAGTTVKHRSRVARDPSQPNLRQVHLVHAELFDDLASDGFAVSPGQMGENITTRGIDLLALPAGSRLHLGEAAVVEITGLRNPCAQLDGIQPGLMEAVLERHPDGSLTRKAGVMATVARGGTIRSGDAVAVVRPEGTWAPLGPV